MMMMMTVIQSFTPEWFASRHPILKSPLPLHFTLLHLTLETRLGTAGSVYSLDDRWRQLARSRPEIEALVFCVLPFLDGLPESIN